MIACEHFIVWGLWLILAVAWVAGGTVLVELCGAALVGYIIKKPPCRQAKGGRAL